MNINQIEWCSYTEGNPDYVQEIEFLEWQSDPEGKFANQMYVSYFKVLHLHILRFWNILQVLALKKHMNECNLKIMQIFSKSLKKCLKKFLLGMELPIRNLKRL